MTIDNELLKIISDLHAAEFDSAADMLKVGPGTPLLTAAADAADNAVDHVLAAALRVGVAAPVDEERGVSTGLPEEPLDIDAPPMTPRPT